MNIKILIVLSLLMVILPFYNKIVVAQICPPGMEMVNTSNGPEPVFECKTVDTTVTCATPGYIIQGDVCVPPVVKTDNTVTCATEGYIMQGDVCVPPPTSTTDTNTTPTTPTPATTKTNDSAISGLIPCDNSAAHPCDFNAFVLFINNVITWFLDLSVIVAMITFAMAGAKMLMNPENAGARSEAIEMFKKTVYGLIIVLTAWLIIHTVISYLVKPDIGALRFLDKTTTAK